MRRLHLFAVLLAIWQPSVVMAAGNVLLPPTNGSSAGPSLGLGAAPIDTTPAPAAQAPIPAPIPATPSQTPAKATEQPPAPPSPTLPPASAQNAAEALAQAKAAEKDLIVPLKGDTSHLPPGTIPTTIIRIPDSTQRIAEMSKGLPYGLQISVAGQSLFGAKDLKAISDKLGLNKDQISSNCIVALRGLMRTDKGNYIIDSGSLTHAQVRYDGMIKSYLLSAMALCTADHLPMGSGIINQLGNRYLVPLQPINCAAPNRQVTSLSINYNGGGTTQCSYN